MNRNGAVGRFHAVLYRVAAIAAVLLILMHAAPARADAVNDLINQLDSDSDKIRLSAALNLTKLGDSKAILPLVKALGNDSNKDVRAAAAVGLGKLVTSSTNKSIKNLAINALKKAEANDSSSFVKTQATKALTALGAGSGDKPESGGTSGGGSGGIYVNIGPMSSKTGNSTNDPKFRQLMVKIAQKTMAKAAPKMQTTWSGGSAPTKSQLQAKAIQGFYVDGTLNTVTVTTKGSSSLVECKISMLLASFPDKSVFGFLNGGAKVQASSSPTDVQLAGEDCVAAVVEDLIAKKIVPTITTKASP